MTVEQAGGFRCSTAASERGDSMVATAPPAQAWLLIEHEGAWPVNALDVLPAGVAQRLAARASAMDARISLIRRPGRHPRIDGPFRWAIANTRPGHEGIRWAEADDPAELIDADWSVAAGQGEAVAIVCAHSRHDVCCAIKGRPTAADLDVQWPGRVWECSHLGGDRFAATMVLLPHGLCYGRVTSEVGRRILYAHEHGFVVPENLRGRSSYSRHAQAAQALARESGWASSLIGAIQPVSERAVSDGQYEVVLAAEPALMVRFRERTVELGTPATCRSTIDAFGREYDLTGVVHVAH
ncbi:MAG: sucrase ferredoxin [Candidatus Nanopelagicales bacterium]